jgi:hypothetical protein
MFTLDDIPRLGLTLIVIGLLNLSGARISISMQ